MKEELRKSKTNHEIDLESELINRICIISELISNKTGTTISFEETLEFLNNAVNYSEFQIWLGDIKERRLSKLDRVKVLLSRTSDNDIVRLFDIEQNYDKNNLRSIDKMLDSEFPTPYVMQVVESGTGERPTITTESRKALAKSLLK